MTSADDIGSGEARIDSPTDAPTMHAPALARTAPYYVELARDQVVLWCRCGRSRKQPYCDGSHAGTGILPMRYMADHDEEVLFCGCKRTATPPFCDGAHNALLTAYASDDPDSEANRLVRPVAAVAEGKALLDGGCFVCTVDRLNWQIGDGFCWAAPVAVRDGARHQALFCVDVQPDAAPVLDFGARQVALLFTGGDATLSIGSRSFTLAASPGAEVGACVLPGEAFRVANNGRRRIRFFAAVGPIGEDFADLPRWPGALPARFDDGHGLRLAPVDPARKQAMADRFFQVLVGKDHGASSLTQFIGEIPPGKALPHRHLYEETLIVLAGAGTMWTETLKAPVSAGDVIFLPRKQLHSLQCIGDRPMLVAGVIHPGDNPSINYY
jgi:CDGSH-type Zn-finger protein/quercetin dioxygenase-like cupin family protein